MEPGHQPEIHRDIEQTGKDQDQERAPGVPHGPQGRGSHVVESIGDHPQRSDPQILQGRPHDISRRMHHGQNGTGKKETENAACQPQPCRDDKRAAHGRPEGGLFFCAEILGRQDSGAPGKADVKHDENAQNRTRRPSDCRQGRLAGGPAHDQSICCIVELLEKGTEQHGKKEEEDLLPDDPFRDRIVGCYLCHIVVFCSFFSKMSHG